MDREAAQRRTLRILAFREELAELEADGIVKLEPDQQSAVAVHHDTTLAKLAQQFDVDTNITQGKLSLGMKVASAAGTMALCLAVFLFVQFYWGQLTTGWQVGLLILAPLIPLAAAEWAAPRERTLYATALLVLVSIAAFIVQAVTLGEIFSLLPSPAAPSSWAIYSLLLAYRFRLRVPLIVGLVLAATNITLWYAHLSGEATINPFAHPELTLLAGAAILAIARWQREELQAVFRGAGSALALLAGLILSKAGLESFLAIASATFSRSRIEGGYTSLTLAASAAAISASIRYGRPELLWTGGVTFTLLLLIKLYDWFWDLLPGWAFFGLIGLVCLALLAFFRRLRQQPGSRS
ncbi:MAG: hypothetical protein NTZ56_07625 [Acidobacteria bacterium]|nr:hypothetical protein [Acidobacteriota bacterium]